MLSHVRGWAPAHVHGARPPLPHSRQVRSTTIGAGCAPPVPQKPRSLRAYHAVASPALLTRSLDARSPPAIRAQKRVSPHGTLGSTGGRPLPPRKRKRQKQAPAPGGVSAQPHKGLSPRARARCQASLQTLFSFFRVCSWFPSVASCPTPGPGPVRGWGPHPLACGSAHAFSHSCGKGPSPGRGQGQGAGSRSPVHTWLRGSGRPETAYRRLGRPPRGTRVGAFGPRGDAPREDCG